MVLEDDSVGKHARHGLRVTIAAIHGKIQPEAIAVLYVNVASLAPAQGVNAAAERLVRLNQDLDFGITTVNSN